MTTQVIQVWGCSEDSAFYVKHVSVLKALRRPAVKKLNLTVCNSAFLLSDHRNLGFVKIMLVSKTLFWKHNRSIALTLAVS